MAPQQANHPWSRAFRDALISGSAASILSGVALSACSKAEVDSAAGALNGPSQWVWGEAEAHTRQATARHTAVGYAIHHLMSIFWATFHERIFGGEPKSAPRHCVEAVATTLTAYVVDYYVAPRRLRPGFKKHLGPQSMFIAYAAFAAGLAITTIAREADRRQTAGDKVDAPDYAGARRSG